MFKYLCMSYHAGVSTLTLQQNAPSKEARPQEDGWRAVCAGWRQSPSLRKWPNKHFSTVCSVLDNVQALQLDRSWPSDLAFLGLSFLIHKMRIVIASPLTTLLGESEPVRRWRYLLSVRYHSGAIRKEASSCPFAVDKILVKG